MKRSLWSETLTKTSCPAWPCPVCRKGSLVMVSKSLTCQETTESKRSHDDPAWDPDWIRYTFTAWARCGHLDCDQQFAIAGTGGVGPEMDYEGDMEWEDYFSPMVCYPMPHIIEVPAKCPDDVANELRGAFELFWAHRAACAGRIRVALECLMSHLGVPKRKKTSNGKYNDLTLHARIDLFAKRNKDAGAQLMALKWLGNAGSHDTGVSAGDLLDAFEILEHTLSEILDKRSAKVAAIARRLTKKHGR